MSAGAIRIPIAPIYLEHFDEGMIRTLGGTLQPCVVDGEEVQCYVVLIPGVCGTGPNGSVRIYFGKGRDVLQPAQLPYITIVRSGIEDDLPRVRHKTLAHRVPAFQEDEETVTSGQGSVTGFKRVEEKEASWPVNITYNVQIRARNEADFLRMFRWVTEKLRAQDLMSYITVYDSAKAPRNYDIFRESMADIGEYVDVNDVVKGYEFSYRVEAEIDIEEPRVEPTVQDIQVSTQPLEV